MLNHRKAFQDEEIILSTPGGQVHLLASGTPIINELDIVNSGVIILRPIKEVHKLVNRFSGAKAAFRFEDILTVSEKMRALIENAKAAASSMSNVLIEGESGTGKELFAQAIHNHSRRNKGPFIALNCGAIPRELVGSELFGYVEGAFSGARKGGNSGKFELASGGTLFLDEIGDMPFEQQVALLRVIQEKSITRIGGNQIIPVDVRIICATNKNLQLAIQKGQFRKDLYYRLNVISIKIPPLRERKEDVALLFRHFLGVDETAANVRCEPMDELLWPSLLAYDWPGNVRELQNVVERMLNTASGSPLGIEHLPPEIRLEVLSSARGALSAGKDRETGETIRELRERSKRLRADEERAQIMQLLQLYRGNVSRVARGLGISRTTLYKKMEKYRIDD
jgi:transcriptional regulator with PAS, ATPase and Fis domain